MRRVSNSKIWQRKKIELQQKEQFLLDELNVNKAKTKKIVLWSLGSGAIALMGYGIYRAFSTSPSERIIHKKKKKRLPKTPKDLPIIDSVVESLGPILGAWLVKQLKD